MRPEFIQDRGWTCILTSFRVVFSLLPPVPVIVCVSVCVYFFIFRARQKDLKSVIRAGELRKSDDGGGCGGGN